MTVPDGVVEATRRVTEVALEVWVKRRVGEVVIFVPTEALGRAEAVGGEFGDPP